MIQFKKLPFNIENVWLISDTHAYHKNICAGSSTWEDKENSTRQFANENSMTLELIKNINSKVKYDDLLIHCGDWSFGGKENVEKFRNQINCRSIILHEGNHDHNINDENKNLFYEYTQIGYWQIDHLKFVCCHYPLTIWHQSHKDVPLFYGHVHGSFKNKGKSLDIGIDNTFRLLKGYNPISLKKAYDIAMSNETVYESHHNIKTN